MFQLTKSQLIYIITTSKDTEVVTKAVNELSRRHKIYNKLESTQIK